jgi:glycosyltransferase involved in cell wall biosynthesis
VFAHSAVAKEQLIEALALPAEKVRVIPHGDLSVALGPPVPAVQARQELGLDNGRKLALMFGAVEPYKGQEEIIEWWRRAQPNVTLAIIGRPISSDYAAHIVHSIGDAANITHRIGWLSEEHLRLWLSAADVAIFNYRRVFTSGAASLARSYGVPVLLPSRLETVFLDEPTLYVRRFISVGEDFGKQLTASLSVAPDFAMAASWREASSWEIIAALTAEGYRSALRLRQKGNPLRGPDRNQSSAPSLTHHRGFDC